MFRLLFFFAVEIWVFLKNIQYINLRKKCIFTMPSFKHYFRVFIFWIFCFCRSRVFIAVEKIYCFLLSLIEIKTWSGWLGNYCWLHLKITNSALLSKFIYLLQNSWTMDCYLSAWTKYWAYFIIFTKIIWILLIYFHVFTRHAAIFKINFHINVLFLFKKLVV